MVVRISDWVVELTQYQIAPYFAKVECFCFEEQRIRAGEEVDLPVFFFIDRDIVDEPQLDNLDDVVLNYTFFRYAMFLILHRAICSPRRFITVLEGMTWVTPFRMPQRMSSRNLKDLRIMNLRKKHRDLHLRYLVKKVEDIIYCIGHIASGWTVHGPLFLTFQIASLI